MKAAAGVLARAAWLVWGAVEWSFALSLVVFIRGFFPPPFEGLLEWRLLGAAAGVVLTGASGGLARAAAAGTAAAATLWLSPTEGGGGTPALAATALAWMPFLLEGRIAPPPAERGAAAELLAAGGAVVVSAAAWAAVARPPAADLAGLILVLLPAALAAAAAARLGARPARLAVGTLAAAWTAHRLLLATFGLGGWPAAAAALPFGAATAFAFSDAAGLLQALSLRLPSPRAFGAAAAAFAAVGVAAAGMAMETRPDWSHAAQGFVFFTGWVAVWLFCRTASPEPAWGERRVAAAAALALAACLAVGPVSVRAHDPARRALRRLLSRGAPHDAFFDSLWARMGRPDRTPAPWDNPPPKAERKPPAKPDIFLLVIDSLRPDRLGRPGRTPALDALAADSEVFERAFTPYGGTAMAVPALWAGSLLRHGPLPTPFQPLNALERLLTEEGYRRLIAPDVLARILTEGPPGWETFDEGHEVLRRSCPALADLGRRLAPKRPGEPPVFAFAHLYDLHVALRDESGGEGKLGSDAAYERVLSSVDACVGTFVGRLKALGRYEGAVLLVTADHGDSLGEEGRWGHAYTAFPEVIRVPFLLKLPRPRSVDLSARTDEAAFLTDVTPTLARLLGRAPWTARPGSGRALVGPPGERPSSPGGFLVASSYGPVFGALSEKGDSLFLADAVDRAFHLFDLPARGPAVRRELDADTVERGKRSIGALLTESTPH